MIARRWVELVGCGVLALQAAPARADSNDDVNTNAARQFATEGVARYEQGDWKGAWDLFHRANGLVKAPTLAVWEARALDKLGSLVAAEERYIEALRITLGPDAPPAFKTALEEAAVELRALQARIPSLKVVVTGSGAKADGLAVLRNGQTVKAALLGVPHAVDPGRHDIVASAPGVRTAKASLTLAEGSREVVTLSLVPLGVPAPADPKVESQAEASGSGGPSLTHMLGWASLGVGAAGLGVGIITGVMAADEHATVESECPNNRCADRSDGAEALDAFRDLRTVSSIGYIVGALGVGAGTYLVLATPGGSSAGSAKIQPWLGVGSLGLRGAF